MTIPAIPNNDAGPELAIEILTDPVQITAYKVSVADQMNRQSGGPQFADLHERIADIIIETAAQGASILEVHVIDPARVLTNSGFITTDESGVLWPPIEVNFPADRSDATWRLVAVRASKDMSQANLILTFEDRIASALRSVWSGPGGDGNVRQSGPNQSLAGFLEQIVKDGAKVSGVPIRFVALVSPQDPNYQAPLTKPASFNLRSNPDKVVGGFTQAMQAQFKNFQDSLAQIFGPNAGSAPILNISDVENSVGQLLTDTQWFIGSGLPAPPDFRLLASGS